MVGNTPLFFFAQGSVVNGGARKKSWRGAETLVVGL